MFAGRRCVYFWNDAAFSVCQQKTLIRCSIRQEVGGWEGNLSGMSSLHRDIIFVYKSTLVTAFTFHFAANEKESGVSILRHVTKDQFPLHSTCVIFHTSLSNQSFSCHETSLNKFSKHSRTTFNSFSRIPSPPPPI